MDATSKKPRVRGGRGNKTGRTEQLHVRVSPQFKTRVHALTERDDLLLSELIERAVEIYENVSR